MADKRGAGLLSRQSLDETHGMACRVGIENWPGEAIAQWIKNYFGPRKLEFVMTEAHEMWIKQQNYIRNEQNQF